MYVDVTWNKRRKTENLFNKDMDIQVPYGTKLKENGEVRRLERRNGYLLVYLMWFRKREEEGDKEYILERSDNGLKGFNPNERIMVQENMKKV